MGEIAKIELSKDLIEPIVRAQLQAAITSALGHREELVASVVHTMMNQKVDEKGQPSSYSYAKPLITWVCENGIREAAHEALKEWMAEHRERLKQQLIAEFSKPKHKQHLAEQMVLGMTKSFESTYKLGVEIKFAREGY